MRFSAESYSSLLHSTASYCFPLRTTLRHILISLQILSSEIVLARPYFSKKCFQKYSRLSAPPVVLHFLASHDILWVCFRFFFVTYLYTLRRSLHGKIHFCFPRSSVRVILFSFDQPQGARPMEWTTPQHEEIDLNCEISSYANAEL